MLKHHAKTLPRDLVRGKAGDVFALENDIARGRPFDAHDGLHRGRLAGTVRTDQAEDLAGAQIEVEVLDGGEAAEELGQPADLENRNVADRIHYCRAPCARTDPRKPLGKNRITSSAQVETMNVANSPVGRRNSPATIRKIAPSAAPNTVRRPPRTAATITCTPTATSTTVPTDAVPK